MNMPPEYSLWVEFGVVLTIASLAVFAAALLAERWIASAVWRRTMWRAAAVGLFVMLAIELTGIGRGMGQLLVTGISGTLTSEREVSHGARPERGDVLSPGPGTDARERSTEFVETSGPAHGRVGRPASNSRGADGAVGRQGETGVATFPNNEGPKWFAAEDRGWAGGLGDPADIQDEPIENDLDSFDRLDSIHDVTDAAWTGASLHDGETAATDNPSAGAASESRAAGPVTGSIASSARPSGAVPAAWPVVIWAMGCIVVMSYVLVGQILLGVFRWRNRALPDLAVRRRAQRLARHLGVRRPVRIVESRRLPAPVAFGVLAPTVVLPGGFTEDFDPEELDAMLVHEVAHLAAGDPAWQLAVNLLCGLLWWQPAVWLLRRRLRMASETAADEATLVVPEGPEHLASCLVAMGRRLVDAPRLGWLPMVGDGYRSNLGRRVTRLLGLGRKTWRAPRRARAAIVKSLIVMVLVTAMVTCTAWVRPRAAHAEGESTMKQLKMTWAESLAAVTLVAVLGSLSGDTLADQPETDERFTPHGAVVALLQDDEGEEREREGEARRERDREEGEREGEGRRERERDEEGREGEARREREREEGEREGERRREHEREEGQRERERHQEREREEGEREGERRREREGEHERENVERELHKLERAREELARHAEELEHRLRELPDDADEAAREIEEKLEHVRREAREVEERLHDIREGRRGEERERPEHPEEVVRQLMREREELMAHARELHEAMENARREGNEGAAREIAEKIEGLKREFQRTEREIREIREEFGRRERPRGEGGPREDIERRLHHLRVAADNLRAAGMHEQAGQLMQHAERLARELHGPRPEGERERPRPEHREGPPPHELERAVRDMHRQMEEMRGRMEEMQRTIKMLIERERGER
jgi:beta-lactamase regulating signal transducer with metallopeptidase domain